MSLYKATHAVSTTTDQASTVLPIGCIHMRPHGSPWKQPAATTGQFTNPCMPTVMPWSTRSVYAGLPRRSAISTRATELIARSWRLRRGLSRIGTDRAERRTMLGNRGCSHQRLVAVMRKLIVLANALLRGGRSWTVTAPAIRTTCERKSNTCEYSGNKPTRNTVCVS